MSDDCRLDRYIDSDMQSECFIDRMPDFYAFAGVVQKLMRAEGFAQFNQQRD